jgi:mono/diheme cytochrome c family protein
VWWAKLHGASTHFPLALVVLSLACDSAARLFPRARGLAAVGAWTLLVGALGTLPAIASGLVLTRGHLLGHDVIRLHHLFVWPATLLTLCMAARRVWRPTVAPLDLAGMGIAAVLMLGAGYWGGELMLAQEQPALAALVEPRPALDSSLVADGSRLFSSSCAHCHGLDARGDEGPDLHDLDVSDRYIASTIRRGIRGEMPSFAKKHDAGQIAAIIAYLRSLR